MMLASAAASILVCEALLRQGLVSNPLSRRLAAQGTHSADAPLVLLIGDSFLYKEGLLDSLLSSHLGSRGLRLVNLAVPGAGPIQYEASLVAFGRRLRPDIVVVGIYAGNDITDLLYHPDYRDRSLRGAATMWLRPRLWRWHLYHVANAVRNRVSQGRALTNAAESVAQTADPEHARLTREGLVSPFFLAAPPSIKQTFLADNLLLARPESRTAFEDLTALLDGMHERSVALGARLLIVVFPEASQVSHRGFEFWRRVGFSVDSVAATVPLIQNRLSQWAADRGVLLVDCLPALRDDPDVEYYSDMDVHFNEAGNRAVAILLATAIVAARQSPAGGDPDTAPERSNLTGSRNPATFATQGP